MTANGDGYRCSVGRVGDVLSDCETASGLVGRIEDLEARRSGVSIADIRPAIARRIGIGTGTLANIRRQRRKGVPAWLMRAINAVLIEVLRAEIQGLEHEIRVRRARTDSGDRADSLRSAETALAVARSALGQATR